jgi:hypothetical protein
VTNVLTQRHDTFSSSESGGVLDCRRLTGSGFSGLFTETDGDFEVCSAFSCC